MLIKLIEQQNFDNAGSEQGQCHGSEKTSGNAETSTMDDSACKAEASAKYQYVGNTSSPAVLGRSLSGQQFSIL